MSALRMIGLGAGFATGLVRLGEGEISTAPIRVSLSVDRLPDMAQQRFDGFV